MYFLRPRGKGGVVEDKKVLNSSLWSSLHLDLVEKVLTKLPFSALLKCRTVCKRWNELILSENFVPANEDPPKCVLFHFTYYTPTWHQNPSESQYFTAYDTRRNAWVELSLDFLKLDPDLGNWEMAASGGGLLCLASSLCEQFVICNPVTKQWRLLDFPEDQANLPPTENENHRPIEHLLVGLLVDKETGHYRLVIGVTYGTSARPTLIYDSKKRVWNQGVNAPAWASDCFSRKPGVSCKGALYWIADDERLGCPRLYKYDVEKNSWTTVLLTIFGWDVRILEHRNEVMLMTPDGLAFALRKGRHVSGPAMQLLLMTGDGQTCHDPEDDQTIVVKEKKKLPKPLRGRLGNFDGVQNTSCIGAGELICFIREVLEGKYRTRLEFIVRDFSNNTSASANLDYGYVSLCWVLEPSLTALA